ncbi:tetratricopeptide repeat protein [Desulfoluna spongiiphila]|uniref:Tetratricopeptide repeat-containing protein n=1 Tax=Desulfoluna spongiiphila TaxID=419481 RepID=A0A1G5ET64_9BACT|nr:tetratricopeptide repeat protein [Desulfoluna spongiiphila]SCY30186.1 hypothetical protein SAMN05216233_106205 [Desulfoluna spongiiphila]
MKKGKTWISVIGVVLLLVILVGLGSAMWRSHAREKRATDTLARAEALLSENKPIEALALLRRALPQDSDAFTEKKAALEIQAHLHMRNVPRLLHLYDRHPHLFLPHEEAALFACRALLQTGNKEPFHILRNSWKGRETDSGAWLALDVDALLVEGKRDAALAMLSEKRPDDEAETVRLIRLALLNAPDHLEEAWSYLEEASLLAPTNSDIRLFRGQILEQLGKPAAARVEYVAAHLAEPDNPRVRDQLAEFYRRQGNPNLALATWEAGLSPTAPGYLWLKAMFWSRMVKPLERDWTKATYPEERLTPLLVWLGHLPDTSLWDEETFYQVPDRTLFLSTRQELFWIRVVDHLARNQETQALLLLERNPFKARSWNPEMEEALVATLRFRKWGAFPREPKGDLTAGNSHPLFRQLIREDAEPSPELTALLQSPEAFSALFLAGGWLEAALHLHRMPEIPSGFPDWVSYGLTQAIRYNRSTEEALAFAQRQPQSPALTVLTGELLLSENRIDQGMARLADVAKAPTEAGFRAAWLTTMVHLDQGQPDKARQALENHPGLLKSLTGRELMARIAIAENKPEEATRLYTEVLTESTEAKVWLARQAYVAKRWEEARRLTTELNAQFPDSLQFRANLAAIADAEAKATQEVAP